MSACIDRRHSAADAADYERMIGMTQQADLVIIGGGPAGMAAALEARKAGLRDILILERDSELGGILQQCIHNGFGLHFFGEELTGPEYAWRFIKQIGEQGIACKLDTMVLDISKDRVVTAVNSREGLLHIKAKAVVLAMGCRERTRGALNVPGSRPAGIYTAGAAQRFVNMEGYLPGRTIVILGSGDIGLIMARRLTLEGTKVKMVCELLPYSGGLTRNIVQCLEDFNIPLRLSHTITGIEGNKRLRAVTVSQVDERRRPIPGTEERVECDTLLLSVGLIPENELSKSAGVGLDPVTSGPVVNESMETGVEGVFACGNVVQVHDLVDFVTQESMLAGRSAAEYVLAGKAEEAPAAGAIRTVAGSGVRYIVPQIIRREHAGREVKLFFRVTDVHRNARVVLKAGDQALYSAKKPRVAPGEMENIQLTPELLRRVGDAQELRVELETGN